MRGNGGFLPVAVVTGGVRFLRYEYVEGVLDYGEVLRGSRHYFPVYVDGHFGICLDADMRGPEVVHAVHLDEVSALEVSGDPEEVPVPAEFYSVDVEGAVVYARFGGYDHTPSVEASVADGDLQETVVLDALVVAVGEGHPGGEGFVFQERLDGGRGVGQRTRAPLQPRGEGPSRLHTEPDGGDVHVVIVAGQTEVDVDEFALRYCLAGTRDVLGNTQRAGEIVGRAEGQETEDRVVVRQEVDHGADGTVAAAEDQEPVTGAVVEDLAHRLGKPCGISYGVGYAEGNAELLKAIQGLEERALASTRARVDDQGHPPCRDVRAQTATPHGGARSIPRRGFPLSREGRFTGPRKYS